MPILRLLLLLIVTLTAPVLTASISHLNHRNFLPKLQEADFSLVYVYSSSCGFCKEFTPIFQQLASSQALSHLNISFGKMDGPGYDNLTESLEVFSYPSVLLFKGDVALPLHCRKERTLKGVVEWVLARVNSTDDASLLEVIQNMTAQQRVISKAALFTGTRDSYAFRAWDVIAARDGYIGWAFIEQGEGEAR